MNQKFDFAETKTETETEIDIETKISRASQSVSQLVRQLGSQLGQSVHLMMMMANFHQSITPSRNHRHHRQGYRRESSHWHHRQDDRRESSHWQLQPPQVFLFTTPTSFGRPTKLYPFTASTSLHPVITVFDLGGIERDDEYLGGA